MNARLETVQAQVDRAMREARPAEVKPPFQLVPIADLVHVEPPAPIYAWETLVPLFHVTLWTAHGGGGKSTLLKMLAIACALGIPLFGISTKQCKVAFFSAEDGADLLRYRLRFLCRAMEVNVADLQDRLFILDATNDDPALFAEITEAGRREGRTTPTYDALRDFMRANSIGLLVVDNASDTFDASEIDRARVRGFMRSLARLAREFEAAVVLIAHVDKGTSRGDRAGTEGYSGSTAFHNSARSRVFQYRDKDGALVLEQQKNNLGPLHAPIRLIWPHGGIPQVDQPFGPVVQAMADRNHEKVLLKLIAEYTARGEHVSAATVAKTNAPSLLSNEPSYPKLKPAEVFDVLRKSERAGRLVRASIRTEHRKFKEIWQVTDQGAAFAGISAPSAPSTDVGALGAVAAEGAPSAPSSALGGMGDVERAQVAALQEIPE